MAKVWLLSIFTVGFVAAETDGLTDFSNNLASDIGPLLVLFGESMTKQYLSESTSFLDYFIFAMAPIGIITAVVSTIRLCGHSSLRAFIGRSQEGDGVIEAELCTSTSRDVCELFTRGGITRVLGRPSILELIYDPRRRNDDTAGLFLFRHYLETEVLQKSRASKESGVSHRSSDWEEVPEWRWPWTRHNQKNKPSRLFAPHPNLSLNVGIVKRPKWVFFTVALVGFILQAGVLVLAGTGVWILGWNLNQGAPASRLYAPIMYIVGTVLMCGGMWGCAALIGQSTDEIYFRRNPRSKTPTTHLLWIQPGPQVIGDQSFDPFAYIEKTDDPLRVWTSSMKSAESQFEAHTFVAVLAVLIGYIMQFIGLRGMKAWVSLAQLATTIMMSILRGALRMQRMSRKGNRLADKPDIVAGYELDWLAFNVFWPGEENKVLFWHITGQYEEAENDGDRDDETPTDKRSSSSVNSLEHPAPCGNTPEPEVFEDRAKGSHSSVTCEDLFQARVRLAHLTGHISFANLYDREYQKWKDDFIKVRGKALKLSAAVCQAAEGLNCYWKGTPRHDIMLRIKAAASIGGSGLAPSEKLLCIPFKPPSQSTQAGWTIDSARLEAILGLCIWSSVISEYQTMDSDRDLGGEALKAKSIKTMRIISAGPDDENWRNTADKQIELNLWFGSNTIIQLAETVLRVKKNCSYGLSNLWAHREDGEWTLCENKRQWPPAERSLRFCGWNRVYEAQASANINTFSRQPDREARVRVQTYSTNGSLLDIWAQELFVSLSMSLTSLLDIGDATFAEDTGSIRLDNPIVSTLAKAFTESALGSHSDALLCIIPALGNRLRTPSQKQMLSALIEKANSYRQQSEWERAETLLQWACQRYLPTYEEALRALGELYRWSFAQYSDDERHRFASKGIDWMHDNYVNQNAQNIRDILDDYKAVKESISRFRTGNLRLAEAIEIRRRLVEALEGYDRKETLYLLCFVTTTDVRSVQLRRALPLAARNGWNEVASSILEMDADPNSRGDNGRTALSYNAEKGDDIKLYIHYGAFPDLPDLQQRTPLLWAAKNGHEAVVKLLIEKGANIEAKDTKYGKTPLLWAAENRHEKVVKLLIEKGANIEAKDTQYGNTPLLLAAKYGYEAVVKLLIEKGANIEAKDTEYGNTPLLWAAKYGHEAVIKLLIEKGANIEAKDARHGKTPLLWVAENRHEKVVKLLIEKGANIEAKDTEYGNTPLLLNWG